MNVNFSIGGTMVITAATTLESMALKQWVSGLSPNPDYECTEIPIGLLVIEDSDGKDLIEDRWEAAEMVKKLRGNGYDV